MGLTPPVKMFELSPFIFNFDNEPECDAVYP